MLAASCAHSVEFISASSAESSVTRAFTSRASRLCASVAPSMLPPRADGKKKSSASSAESSLTRAFTSQAPRFSSASVALSMLSRRPAGKKKFSSLPLRRSSSNSVTKLPKLMGSCDEHAASKFCMSIPSGILGVLSFFLTPKRSFMSAVIEVIPSSWSSMNDASLFELRAFKLSFADRRQNTTNRSTSFAFNSELRCDMISTNSLRMASIEMQPRSFAAKRNDSAFATRRMAMDPASAEILKSR
mmetsp:Transcript_10869/g.28744  ORF Transcript_10869/g.28744 Transcript_10869/m.28744 type:complete len:245 (+) Transcript_10869:717-1451(+)